MFGKLEWFRMRPSGWGLRPATWQGYAHMAVWMGAIVIPFLGLAGGAHRWPEALIWLATSLGAYLYDVRSILHSAQPRTATAKRDVFYIGDEATTRVAK